MENLLYQAGFHFDVTRFYWPSSHSSDWMRRSTNKNHFENHFKFIKLPFVSIQLQRAHLPPVFVPYYESSVMSHTINPKDQKMFSMNFNFINTINLYWLQLYSIFVFYSKMLINQSVINFLFSPPGGSNKIFN